VFDQPEPRAGATNGGYVAANPTPSVMALGPIAAVGFSDVANHVNCTTRQPAAAPLHRTFPIVIGETKGCFSVHSEIILP
jgi:hypothetical protein